jgi:hypothetical protein
MTRGEAPLAPASLPLILCAGTPAHGKDRRTNSPQNELEDPKFSCLIQVIAVIPNPKYELQDPKFSLIQVIAVAVFPAVTKRSILR